MGLRIFLLVWKDFATKTEFGIILQYFSRIEVGLRLFLSEEKREKELDLENFCPKKQKEERELHLKQIVQVKEEKESKVKQVRRGVRSPVFSAGKKIMIESPSQNDSKRTACCNFMPPKKIGLYLAWLAAGTNRKKAPFRNFLWKIFVQLQWYIYSISLFSLQYFIWTALFSKVSFN